MLLLYIFHIAMKDNFPEAQIVQIDFSFFYSNPAAQSKNYLNIVSEFTALWCVIYINLKKTIRTNYLFILIALII